MRLGRVVGRVVATRKDPLLAARTLLLVQPLDGAGKARGPVQVMVDATGAGAGEVVLTVRGKEAAFAFLPAEVPADAAVAGVVDHWLSRGKAHAGIVAVRP